MQQSREWAEQAVKEVGLVDGRQQARHAEQQASKAGGLGGRQQAKKVEQQANAVIQGANGFAIRLL